MARGKVLQGDTVEKKLDHADLIFSRLLRRPPQKATVVIPPIPFCSYVSTVSESGLVARWIFPVDGIIKTLHIFAGMVAEKVQPSLLLLVRNASKGTMNSIPYKVGPTVVELDVAIHTGDSIEIKTSDPLSVGEISLGLLFEVAVAKARKQLLILDDVYDDLEKENAGKKEG